MESTQDNNKKWVMRISHNIIINRLQYKTKMWK